MTPFNRPLTAAWLLSMTLAVIATAPADVVTLEPIKDNTLYEDPGGAWSNGAGQHFFVGKASGNASNMTRRGVMAFDITTVIPAGSTIERVTLTLNMSRTPESDPQPISLHRALADWGEGTSDAPLQEGRGAPSTPDDATWIHTHYDTSFWNDAGGDFTVAASVTEMVSILGTYTFGSSPGMVTDVQTWLDSPPGNFGWVLVGNEAVLRTVKRFDTREHPDPTVRPILTIDFTPPPAIIDCNGNGIDDAIDIANGTSPDCDGNGVPDECQDDSDGDGTIDPCDGCPNDANKTAPGDCGCGIPDADSDGDGVPDCNDLCPGADDNLDSDGDGVPDCLDGCPDDPNKIVPGEFGCGVEEADRDGDGVPDSVDACPDDPNKAADPGACGCGTPDLDSDGDGVLDCDDFCPNDPDKSAPGVCGCGQPDIDSDGDGIADCIDRCPDDPDKFLPGICGCGSPDLDSDGDGVLDCDDLCPGADDTLDTDGDGVVDCLDNCPQTPNPDQTDADGDGVGDVCQPDEDAAEPDDDAGRAAGEPDESESNSDNSTAPPALTLMECGTCGMGSMPALVLLLAGMCLTKVGRGRERRFLGKAPRIRKGPPS
ncbi:MAG: thrombospondin type 3 repeat-containing protein [Planctomycetes bacterium]|nr:thrombospondin type 3 repeat-containing protein [Planctomycetota bacterium]